MNAFEFHNPTKIYFGENAVSNLGRELAQYGKNILLTYGGGSIKKSGLYDTVMQIMKNAGKEVFEISGIMANPRTEKVYEGIRLCKEKNIALILAIGGGSVLDCSKAMAAGARTDRDFWQSFYLNQEDCKDALPLGTILTLAATGSEMNGGSVITHWESNIKTHYIHPLLYPKFSILDPTYTYTVPREQMVYGGIDIFSHLLEGYFSAPDTPSVSDDLAEAVMKSVMENLEVAMMTPTDYVARSNLMWASTVALNGIVQLGKMQDWQTHMIEHTLSGFYDIPHGAGLAIIFPAYMRYIYRSALAKFVRYAQNIWHVDAAGKTEDEIALEGIQRTKDYFKRIGAPVSLTEAGIPAAAIPAMAKSTLLTGTGYQTLTTRDIENILREAL